MWLRKYSNEGVGMRGVCPSVRGSDESAADRGSGRSWECDPVQVGASQEE